MWEILLGNDISKLYIQVWGRNALAVFIMIIPNLNVRSAIKIFLISYYGEINFFLNNGVQPENFPNKYVHE